MNKQEALGFAVSSAIAALDNGDGFADPINEHRDNIRDTLNDEGASEHEGAAWELFDKLVAGTLQEAWAWAKANR